VDIGYEVPRVERTSVVNQALEMPMKAVSAETEAAKRRVFFPEGFERHSAASISLQKYIEPITAVLEAILNVAVA